MALLPAGPGPAVFFVFLGPFQLLLLLCVPLPGPNVAANIAHVAANVAAAIAVPKCGSYSANSELLLQRRIWGPGPGEAVEGEWLMRPSVVWWLCDFTEKSSDVCRVSCQLHVLCVFNVLKGGKML